MMGLTTHVVTVVTECLRGVSIFRHEQFAQDLEVQGRLEQHVKCNCMIALYCIPAHAKQCSLLTCWSW